MKKSVLVLALLLLVACSNLVVNNDSNSTSKYNGRELIVYFKSWSCHHYFVKAYKFKNNKVSISINHHKIGMVKTTDKELKDFEKFFEFYDNRKLDFRGCTKHEDIKYELYEGEKLLESEHYYDSSCPNFKDRNITALDYFEDKVVKENGEVERKKAYSDVNATRDDKYQDYLFGD